jgi:hypothetical protein
VECNGIPAVKTKQKHGNFERIKELIIFAPTIQQLNNQQFNIQ